VSRSEALRQLYRLLPTYNGEDHAESEGLLTYYHELPPDSSLVAEIAPAG
jgi:hypothetical protein